MAEAAGRVFYESELAGAAFDFLLVIYYAGRTFRFASRPIDVETEDGVRHFDPMSEFEELEVPFNFETDSPGELAASFDAIVFPSDVAIPLLEARGHSLSEATGELSVLIRGDAYKDRKVLLAGSLDSPTFADPDQHPNAVSFTLENPTYNDQALFPVELLTRTQFPTLGDEYVGLPLPFVFGLPGLYREWDGAPTQIVRGSPAIPVDSAAEQIAIAGHQIVEEWFQAGPPNIGLLKVDPNAGFSAAPVRAKSLYTGATYIVVDTTASPGFYEADAEYWVSEWGQTPSDVLGAFPRLEDASKEMGGAGDLLFYLLQQSSLTVDLNRTAVAREKLNRFRVAGYIETQVAPYDWITDNLSTILPMAFQTGPRGVYPVVWDFDAKPVDAVANLVVGPDLRREGPVDRDADNIVNQFTIEYAPDNDSGYLRNITVSGSLAELVSDGASLDFDVRPDFYARQSFLKFGTIADSVTSDIVFDNVTAQRIISWKLRANAFPKLKAKYTASVRHAWLEPGMVVTITDPSLHWESRVALIESLSWSLEGPIIGLMLIPDPPRDLVPI